MNRTQCDVPQIRLTCRNESCVSDMTDLLSLLPAIKAGWDKIVPVPESRLPAATRWWTHIGSCPRCQELEQASETSSLSFKVFGVTVRLPIAS